MIDHRHVVREWTRQATRRKVTLFCCACLSRLNLNPALQAVVKNVATRQGGGQSAARTYRHVINSTEWRNLLISNTSRLVEDLVYSLGVPPVEGQVTLDEIAVRCAITASCGSSSVNTYTYRWDGVMTILDDIAGPTLFDAMPESAFRAQSGILRRTARGMAGQGDLAALPVLADLVQDVGPCDPYLLDHLTEPGPHYPGCWALDYLAGFR